MLLMLSLPNIKQFHIKIHFLKSRLDIDITKNIPWHKVGITKTVWLFKIILTTGVDTTFLYIASP